MKVWHERPTEIAYLMNPAFCGALVAYVIERYKEETGDSFPFLLTYLILPLILHKETREKINSRTKMAVWIEINQPILIGFAQRVKSFVEITHETLDFLLNAGMVKMKDNALLETTSVIKQNKVRKLADEEILNCFKKAKHLAKWFAHSGTVETIYIHWGIRP